MVGLIIAFWHPTFVIQAVELVIELCELPGMRLHLCLLFCLHVPKNANACMYTITYIDTSTLWHMHMHTHACTYVYMLAQGYAPMDEHAKDTHQELGKACTILVSSSSS